MAASTRNRQHVQALSGGRSAGLLARRVAAAILLANSAGAIAQAGTGFTYQGRLSEAGQPKTGLVDLRFDAFTVDSGGAALNAVPVVLDGVPVVNGEFSVVVDLGSSVFSGQPVFLEIAMREDGVGDAANPAGFATLAPRQQVTPTPYALRANTVTQDSIASGEIANGSISSADLASGAVTASKIAANAVASSNILDGTVTGADVLDGSLTAADVNTTSTTTGLQRRLTANCASGALLRGIAADGAPVCDVVADLLPAAQAQSTVRGFCRVDGAIQRINDDGSVTCVYSTARTALVPVTVDSVGDVGSHLSVRRVALSNLLFGMVAYYDATNQRLKFSSCGNATCGSITTRVIDDPANDVGQFVSLATINSRASMAYYDATADDLKLAICADFNCSAAAITIRTIDSAGDVGRFAEIMDINDRIGIAYHDSSNNTYKFALCNDADCTAPTVTTLAGLSGGGIAFSDVAAARQERITRPRFIAISGGSAVVMVSCTTTTCSSFTTQTISSSADVGPPLAMTTIRSGQEERHWAAYSQPGAVSTRTVHCADAECAQVSGVVGTGSQAPLAGIALAPRPQGVPIIVDARATAGTTLFARRFENATGAVGNFLSGTGDNGGPVDLAGLTDGGGSAGVGVFYYDSVGDDLKYIRCQRDDCSEL